MPKGVALQVRNVLTLVDITAMPTLELLDLLVEKVETRPSAPSSTGRKAVLDTWTVRTRPLRSALPAGGYDVVELLDTAPSCAVNHLRVLEVAQPSDHAITRRARVRESTARASPHLGGSALRDSRRGSGAGVLRACVGLRPQAPRGDRINVFLDERRRASTSRRTSKSRWCSSPPVPDSRRCEGSSWSA